MQCTHATGDKGLELDFNQVELGRRFSERMNGWEYIDEYLEEEQRGIGGTGEWKELSQEFQIEEQRKEWKKREGDDEYYGRQGDGSTIRRATGGPKRHGERGKGGNGGGKGSGKGGKGGSSRAAGRCSSQDPKMQAASEAAIKLAQKLKDHGYEKEQQHVKQLRMRLLKSTKDSEPSEQERHRTDLMAELMHLEKRIQSDITRKTGKIFHPTHRKVMGDGSHTRWSHPGHTDDLQNSSFIASHIVDAYKLERARRVVDEKMDEHYEADLSGPGVSWSLLRLTRTQT